VPFTVLLCAAPQGSGRWALRWGHPSATTSEASPNRTPTPVAERDAAPAGALVMSAGGERRPPLGTPSGGDGERRHPAALPTHLWRAPHYPIADVGVIGGGHIPMPGEGSRADHGMLCLDEPPAFNRHGLEVLWRPLEEGVL
jgi:hypothetical protein